jgi:hypothetical protein
VPSSLYEVEVRGAVGAQALLTLEPFEVVSTGRGRTTRRGRVLDQSSLHGVLDHLAGFHLELTAVTPVDG